MSLIIRFFILIPAVLIFVGRADADSPSGGRLENLLKTPDLIYDQNRRDPKLIQMASGYTGVNNGGGGEINDDSIDDETRPGHNHRHNKDVDTDYVVVSGVLGNTPVVTLQCPSRPGVFFPEFPKQLKEIFDIRSSSGEKLKVKDICDDRLLFNAYARLTADLWYFVFNPNSEGWDFVREVRALNKKPIEIRLTKDENKIAGGLFWDPSWFDAKLGVIYLGYLPAEKVNVHRMFRRQALGLMMNEMAHLYTWLLLPQYPQISKWHDFTTYGKRPKLKYYQRGLQISWSTNSYKIQTSEIAALFESFSNMTEYFSGLNAMAFNPFIMGDSNISLQGHDGRKEPCCYFYATDERFRLPRQQLVQNEAYLSTILKRLIVRVRNTDNEIYGYPEPILKNEPACSADDKTIYDLAKALRMILTDSSYQNRTDYLFYQWMEAFDKIRVPEGYDDEGTKLIREFFLFDMKTGKSILDQFEITDKNADWYKIVFRTKQLGNPEDFLSTSDPKKGGRYCF